MENKMEEYKKLLLEYANELLDMDHKSIKEDTDLMEYEGFNSMFVIELIMRIEEITGLTIPDEMYALDRYKSVQSILEQIELLMKNNN